MNLNDYGVQGNLDFEKKLRIDYLVEQFTNKFYWLTLTELKCELYRHLKFSTGECYTYFLSRVKEDKFLFENFADVVFEIEFHRPNAEGMENNVTKTKIIQDDAGNYIALKLFEYIKGDL